MNEIKISDENKLHLTNFKTIGGIFDTILELYNEDILLETVFNSENDILFHKYIAACHLLELECKYDNLTEFTSYDDASYLCSNIVDVSYCLKNYTTLLKMNSTILDKLHSLYFTSKMFKTLIDENAHKLPPDDLYYIKSGNYLQKLTIDNLHLIPCILDICDFQYLTEINLELYYKHKILNYNFTDLIIKNCPNLKTVIFDITDLGNIYVEDCVSLTHLTITSFNCNRVNFVNADNLTHLKVTSAKIIHGVNLRTCSVWRVHDRYTIFRLDRQNPTLTHIFLNPLDGYIRHNPIYKNTDWDFDYLIKIGYFITDESTGKLKKNKYYIEV